MTLIKTIADHPPFKAALTHLETNVANLLELGVTIQQIPAPTFDEFERASFVQTRFEQIGLTDVSQDAIGNVYGRLAGDGSQADGQKPVIITAHSDTVFAAETDLSIERKGNFIYGPGIADNSMGVAGLIQLAETLIALPTKPMRNLWFAVNVSEEGLGDLRGMAAVADRFADAEAYIVIEGGMYGFVLHKGIGVKRYKITVNTGGGHSWSDFGKPSAVHTLGHIIAQLDRIAVPKSPKTTLNVGVIEGGTTINTIAATASLQLDLRSESAQHLADLDKQVQGLIAQVNQNTGVTVEQTMIGNRPPGEINKTDALIQNAYDALDHVGCRRIRYLSGSTDANIPLSRGYPAVCIGLTKSSNAHRLDEYLDTRYLVQGMQQLLLLTLATAQLHN